LIVDNYRRLVLKLFLDVIRPLSLTEWMIRRAPEIQ
jgi:hypothetical protein